MAKVDIDKEINSSSEDDSEFKFITARHLEMIDEALIHVGEYGEVRLVVEKGRLRFVVVERSFDALKWHPGKIR